MCKFIFHHTTKVQKRIGIFSVILFILPSSKVTGNESISIFKTAETEITHTCRITVYVFTDYLKMILVLFSFSVHPTYGITKMVKMDKTAVIL